jgi:predicted nucleic acid-binding protein
MPPKPLYYIDSVVLLDFYLLKIHLTLLKLPIKISTIDIMAVDLEVPSQNEIKSFGIIVEETPVFVMENMQKTASKYGVTIYDAALLLVCKTKNAVLLTGDKKLRKAAITEKVSCKGTLWLLEELVLNKILKAEQAALLLERMFLLGRRFPIEESNRKIIAWENIDNN